MRSIHRVFWQHQSAAVAKFSQYGRHVSATAAAERRQQRFGLLVRSVGADGEPSAQRFGARRQHRHVHQPVRAANLTRRRK